MKTDTTTDTKQALRDYIASLGLTYTATFQPRPQPAETVKYPQLHWIITLSAGKATDQFPYSEGMAHIRGYQQYFKTPYDTRRAQEAYRKTCETGKLHKNVHSESPWCETARNQPAPDLLDVLYCLVSDASVRHSAFYEEWAAEYGYDEDSRKGEETYRACQKQTTDLLKILADGKVGRDALDILEKLEELYQDY